jgi:ribonuclease P protein subunit POP4
MTSKPPSDPIFRTLQGIQTSSSGDFNNATTISLLQAAFPHPGVAQQLYAQKLEHRPLSLNPADAPNARESRRQKRLDKLKRKRKPKPLSAKEKRELKVHEILKEDIRSSNV